MPTIAIRALTAGLLAIAASGQQGTPDVREFARVRLSVWQPRMGLAGWKISVETAPVGNLKPRALGEMNFDSGRRTAVIRVLAPYASTPRERAFALAEMTVVHELVHLSLADAGEQEVQQITEALLAAQAGGCR